jgi:hypothetical protein
LTMRPRPFRLPLMSNVWPQRLHRSVSKSANR